MAKYTPSQILGIRHRIVNAQYSLLRKKQLERLERIPENQLPRAQFIGLGQLGIFYFENFTVQLSELFRILKNDEILNAKLKSKIDDRMEYRKKARNTIAKTGEYREYVGPMQEFFIATKVDWDSEFQIIVKHFEGITEELSFRHLQMFREEMRAIEHIVNMNPIKCD